MASRTPVGDRPDTLGRGLDPDSAHTGIGALATDALEPWEVADLTEHLEHCRWCRQESEEFSETTAELARLTATPAPDHIRVAVLAEIGTLRQLPPTPRSIGRLTTAREIDDAEAIAFVGSAPRPRRRRPPVRPLVGLAAAVAVLAGFGGVLVHDELRDRADQRATQAGSTAAQDPEAAAADRQESQILAAPDARVVNRRMPDGSTLTFLVSRSRNAAMIITARLGDPGAGRSYQLWIAQGSGSQTSYSPDRTFAGGNGRRVVLSGDIRDASALAVTVEESGGALKPSGPPVAVVLL